MTGSILRIVSVTYFVPVMVKDHVTVTDLKSVTVTVTSTSDMVDDSSDIENSLSVLHCTALPCPVCYNPVDHCTFVLYIASLYSNVYILSMKSSHSPTQHYHTALSGADQDHHLYLIQPWPRSCCPSSYNGKLVPPTQKRLISAYLQNKCCIFRKIPIIT